MRCCCLSPRGVLCTLGLFIALLRPLAATPLAESKPEELPELFPHWDLSLTLHAAGGYNDNIGLSAIAPEASPFFRSTLEAMALRLPVDGHQLTLLLTGEDTRFLTGELVDHEDLVVAQGEYRRFWA